MLTRSMLHKVESALLVGCMLAALLAACMETPTVPTPQPSPSPSPTASPTILLTPTVVPSRTITPTPTYDPLQPWGMYNGPRLTPVTQIPPPFASVTRPSEVRVIMLLGTDRNAPYVSRTDAIQLILYHPRLSRASLISLPPDLMVYIPGYTMQRLEVAYAVGGWRGLSDTIQYNFGIRPNYYVLVHLDEFTRFIDKSLGGLDVTVYQPYPNPKICGGIPGGTFHMTGDQVLCYIRFREGPDEADRNQRQQDVFRLILLRMVQAGNLARLPDLYKSFSSTIETNLTLTDLLEAVPLTIKLGDVRRVAYYFLGTDELSNWKIPGDLAPSVFLPNRKNIASILQNAMGYVQTPAPLSEVVKTYEAAMTNIPSATITQTPSITSTRTNTLRASLTPSRTLTPSMTFTPSLTPTITPTGPTSTTAGYPSGPTSTTAGYP